MMTMAHVTHTILDVPFDLVSSHQVLDRVLSWRGAGSHEIITITNPHSVLWCHRDEKMAQAHANAGLVLPDGAGIILAARILGYPHNGRVTGPQLMLYLCGQGREHGLRHFFYGGKEGVADKLVNNLGNRFPSLQIAGTYSPPFRDLTPQEDTQVIDKINTTRPDIVWVGLGAPKQEKWMLAHLGRIEATAMIGVGAAFDFHSGNVKWAPAIVRKLGIEWAWRLALEPRRMWRRNLDSPLFLWKVLMQRFGMHNQKPLDATRQTIK